MNIIKVKVNFEKSICQATGIDLITGDYNSTKMVFDFVNNPSGVKVLEMKSPSDNLVYVGEIKNNEVILVGKKEVTTIHEEVTYTKYIDENENIYWYDPESEKIYDNEWVEQSEVYLDDLIVVTEDVSLFNEDGTYIFEISLYGDNSKLTSVYSKIKVKPEQVLIDGEYVTQYLPIFDQLLGDVSEKLEDMNEALTDANVALEDISAAILSAGNLDINISKVNGSTTITITRQNGTTKSESVVDGKDALINGINSISIAAGTNIELVQSNGTLTINNTYDDSEILSDINGLEANKIEKDVDNLDNYTKTNDMNAAISNAVGTETTNRQNADNSLQNQIDAITSASDVVDVVGTYTDLQNYDTAELTNNDMIKVLTDSTHNDALSYYRWVVTDSVGSWFYVGSEGPFYTKSEVNSLLNEKYEKPNSGIPKTDLESDVQTSLEKADTALQEHQDISGKLDVSKVKNETSTTAGDVYDVRYINTMIGDIESLLSEV